MKPLPSWCAGIVVACMGQGVRRFVRRAMHCWNTPESGGTDACTGKFSGTLNPFREAQFGASFYTPLLMDALEHESNEDYAFYARCRGLSEKRLLLCHFFPRAAMGLVPNFLQSIGLALANATVIESIFSIPGFGYLIVNHVLDRDTPMIHAEVFFLALAIALCNIVADLVQWAIGRKKGVA